MSRMILLLIGVVVLGFMAFGLVGIFGLFEMNRTEKRNLANAEVALDDTFDGRPDATFRITLTSIPFATVVAGAAARGYRLAHQSGTDQYGTQTLMFERESA